MQDSTRTGEEVKPPPAPKAAGWFRAMRTPDAIELIHANPWAFVLAYVIAYRSQYSDTFNRHNLKLGEALLGDYASIGMTQQQYRTAKAQLAEWRFATFRATNKGTIGKLMDTRLFSVFRLEGNDQNNKRVTNEQRTGNERVTTTKNIRGKKKEKNGKDSASDSPLSSELGAQDTKYKNLPEFCQG
jgi:uncharacterized protein YdaU (DUF1376 family)